MQDTGAIEVVSVHQRAAPYLEDNDESREAGTMSDNQHVNINARLGMADKVEATVIRGAQSWNFIYIALGFALAIEGTVIQMFTPLTFPCNLLLYALGTAATVWLFICNGRFQNRLIAMKQAYESRPR